MAKRKFKAESERLLDIMIHSIYTHKEIFLREIISNASDAVDKLCYKALTDSTVGMSRGDFSIAIKADKENRLLTVSDNGIGMSKEELETNLGTIAKSGSLDFKKNMAQAEGDTLGEGEIDIIGQFGVGFYSAFIVSDRVTVISRTYGSDQAWKWESAGTDGYTITECEKEHAGTDVIMRLREDTEDERYSEFLEEYTLASLVKKYSDYIRYPIKMERTKYRPKEGGEENETETYFETETLNSMVPIWQRNKAEVTEEDLFAFYKEKFYDYENPIKAVQVDAEGSVSYKALLFIPAKTAYDYYTKDFKKGLQLYSSGVMIMDKCEDLLSDHFRFVRGVVDSPDLSLNISRELLQHDRQLKVIAKHIEKKIKNELQSMLKNDREKYEAFYAQFGLQLKYGTVADFGANADTLKDLLLFTSSKDGKLTSLAEYCEHMPEEQKDIYYATGDSVSLIEALPQAEKIREKGFEILYFISEVDEFVAQALRVYDEKAFKSVNKDDLGLETEEEKETLKQKEESFKDLLTFVKETIGDEVKEVKFSNKLHNQPVCLTAEGSLSFEMEKYLKQVQPESGAKAERVLELNPAHPIVTRLDALRGEDGEQAKKHAKLLFRQATLLAGLPIENPAEYSELVFSLM
ncbi:MAG: molecular chaperone HtpG [Oscillospiraceae bacterium]|jgi:molecular chaperone HtpG|nr:molecular chaperone HtpG [Oscillospiraceae bacterium]